MRLPGDRSRWVWPDRSAIAWGAALVVSIAAGWGLSAAQRWYLENQLHRALQTTTEREGLSLVQITLSGKDMGAVELIGLVDPLVKTMTRETDADRARLLRPGEAPLRTLAEVLESAGVIVLNGNGMVVGEWGPDQTESFIGRDLSSRSYVQQALKGRSSIYTGLSPDRKIRTLLYAAPVFENHATGSLTVTGAVVARKLSSVLDDFFKSRAHAGGMLISPQGVVFAASRPDWELALVGPVTAERAEALTAMRRFADLFRDPARARVVPFDPVDGAVVEVDGRRLAVAETTVEWNDPAGPWRLVLLDDLSAAWSAQQRLAAAALIAALLLGGYALTRQIAVHRRERELQAAAMVTRADAVRTMFRMAPVGVCLIVNGRIEFLNPLLAEQLGIAQFQDWPRPYADDASRELIDAVLRERRRMRDVEVGLIGAGGETRAYVLSSMPFDYEGDKPGVVLWLVDITRRQEAAREARRAMEAAKDAARAKSSFLAGMGHEIRSPMNVIVGMSDLALQTGLDARQRNYLEKVNGAALSLLDLIDDILDFNSIESGRIALERVPFQLDAVLDRLVDLIGLRAEDKGVELLIHRPADVPDALIGDPMRLGQVLINLGANAVKFTDSGEVIVAVERVPAGDGSGDGAGDGAEDEVELRFSVADSGIGMTQETISRLFHSFNQADTSTTRQYGGSGLGLAVSRQLVEMMGGRIQVTSRPGEGSTFSFTVRLGLRQGSRATATRVSAVMADLSQLRVLVADDNRAARDILGALCAGFGMRVDTAVNGANAAQCVLEAEAGKRPYDLVLMDWQMPVLDGLEATRLIADGRLASPPAILLVTAFGRDATLAAAVAEADPRHRPARLLSKPVTASTLLSAIGEATGRASLPTFAPQRGGATRAAMARLTGTRLLVVEDDPVSGELSAELLRAAGLDVTLAPDGQTALELMARPDPGIDAVLMDCQMPKMDGYETTRRLRQDPRWRELPVIALTASASLEVRERILAAGMNGCLSKPLNVDRLFEALTRLRRGPTTDPAAGDAGAPQTAGLAGVAVGADATSTVAPDAELEALLSRLAERLRHSDATAVEIGGALAAALDRRPPPPARAQLLRRVAAAASGFRFDEALALLSWDAGAPAGGSST
ncbi:response regulator [Mitsuaria sp. 7]|uniref:response regulator n=1 Tax=Mitsuaria sp. 7 TaxID=1658665 RepID=UPI00082FFAFD|nr:response regulator [Mitsuaria sp. 7]